MKHVPVWVREGDDACLAANGSARRFQCERFRCTGHGAEEVLNNECDPRMNEHGAFV